MKRIGSVLLLLGLAGAGCLPLRMDEPKKLPLEVPPQAQAPIMVEDVKEDNPEEAVHRLETELRNESQKK